MADSKLTADDLILGTPVAGYGPAAQTTNWADWLESKLPESSGGGEDLARKWLRANIEAAQGAASGAASSVYGGGELIRKGLRAAGIPMANVMETPEAQTAMYAPESFWGQAGRGLERAGEFALGGELATPVSAALKARMALPAVKAASGVLPRVVSAIPSAIAQGGMAGAVGAIQEGEPSGGIGPASVGALASLVAPILSTFAKAKAAKPVFEAVEKGPTSKVPIADTSGLQDVLIKADQLEKQGSSPKVLEPFRALYDTITSPKGTTDIGTLRKIASNLSSIPQEEYNKLMPDVKAYVTELRQAINNVVHQHIPDPILKNQFSQALENYASKSAVQKDIGKTADVLFPKPVKVGLGGFAGYKAWPYIKKIFE